MMLIAKKEMKPQRVGPDCVPLSNDKPNDDEDDELVQKSTSIVVQVAARFSYTTIIASTTSTSK